jgi:RNA-directed DNA polymerase
MTSSLLPVEATAPQSPPNWRKDWEVEWARRPRRRTQHAGQGHEQDRLYFGVSDQPATNQQRLAFTDELKLNNAGLPVLHSEQELASWLQISIGVLRWFTHDKLNDTVWHYIRYTISKRQGGERVILAPKRRLKAIQRQILTELLYKVPVSEQSHGFVPSRSIVTNAKMHVGKDVLLNIDLTNFFPSIIFQRVRGLFISLGYSFPVASALALLCTERDRIEHKMEGQTTYQSVSDRYLIQGAPTSPAIANLIVRSLDLRLDGLARSKGFTYTRYADDLTFSGNTKDLALRILATAKHIIEDEHFQVNLEKIRVSPKSARQTVTGFVVNEQLHTPRRIRKTLRAILFNAGKTNSLKSQNRSNHGNFRSYVAGMIGYVASASKRHAEMLRDMLDKLPPERE